MSEDPRPGNGRKEVELPPLVRAILDQHVSVVVGVLRGPFRGQKQALIDVFEEVYLREMLTDCQGAVSEAARHAGMDRKSFWKLMRWHRAMIELLRVDMGRKGNQKKVPTACRCDSCYE